MTKRSDKTANEIQRLRALRADFAAKRAEILADARYSAEYKHKLLQELTDREAAAAKAQATAAWKQAEKDREALMTEQQKLHAQHQSTYDFAALNYQTQRLRSIVSAPPNALTGDTPASRLAALYDEAVRMNDINQQRALRALGIETLANEKPGPSTDSARARDLLIRMQRDERNDQPAGLAELKQDAQALDFNTRLLRGEIRQTETAITGASSDTAFSLATDWERDVFGESTADRVHWKQPAGKPTDPIDGPEAA